MNNLKKILTILIIVVGVLGFVLWISIVNNPDDNEGIISLMLTLAQILVYGAAAFALIFSIKNIASDPAKLKKTGIAIAALAAVLAIGYGLSDENLIVNEKTVDPSDSKWVGTGLRVFYIMALVALVTMIVSGVKKALK